MIRIVFFIAFYCLFLTRIFAEQIDYFVIEKQAEPFQIKGDEGTHHGIISDVITEIFRNSKYQINTHAYPYLRMVMHLESGRYKNWISYGSPDWEGPQGDNLSSVPIMQTQNILLSAKELGNSFDKLSDLNGKTVILMKGFSYPTLQDHIDRGEIVEQRVNSFNSAFGIIDRKLPQYAGLVTMDIRGRYNLKVSNRNIDNYVLSDFSTVIPSYQIYLSFSSEFNPEIKSFVNERLATLIASGFVEAVIEKYKN